MLPKERALDSRMQKEIDLPPAPEGEKEGDNWFALSGVTPDGRIPSRTLHDGSEWVTLRNYLSARQRKKYYRWVTRMERRSFLRRRKETSGNGDSRTSSALIRNSQDRVNLFGARGK